MKQPSAEVKPDNQWGSGRGKFWIKGILTEIILGKAVFNSSVSAPH